jgi:transposase
MKLWTTGELVKRYKVYKSTVLTWCKNGTFPNAFMQKNGNRSRWVVPASDLENFTPRKKGKERSRNPLPLTVLKRAQRARSIIKLSHGYGKSEILKMIELEKKHLSRVEIAERFGVAEQLVEDILRQAAIKPPKQKKEPPEKKTPQGLPRDLLVQLYVEENLSIGEILKRLKTNYAELYINLRYYEIPLRHNHFRRAAAKKEETLRRLFLEEKLTPAAIAHRLNLTEGYIKRKLSELKIR